MANPGRFLIVAALLVGGILVLTNAFESTTVAAPDPSSSPEPTDTGAGQGNQNQAGGQGNQDDQGGQGQGDQVDEPVSEKPDLTGLRIAVFNATAETGLAGTADAELTTPPWNAQQAMEPGNAVGGNLDVSALYYDDADPENQAAAEFIARRVLKTPDASIEPMGRAPKSVEIGGAETEISSDVQVAIFVGQDYADA